MGERARCRMLINNLTRHRSPLWSAFSSNPRQCTCTITHSCGAYRLQKDSTQLTVDRLPPSECPAKHTVALGEVARCWRTSGSRSSYRRNAASYTPLWMRAPSEGSSNSTGSKLKLIAQWSKLVEP